MPLSYTELKALVESKVITNVADDQINGASIDLTLGPQLLVECAPLDSVPRVVDLAAKPRQFPLFSVTPMIETGYVLAPGQFVLASTKQKFFLPDHLCMDYRLNSSLARAGLNAALAMWCDPGWTNAELTLELKNWTEHHCLRLRPGMKIGQVIIHRITPVPAEKSYRYTGSYNDSANGPVVRA